MATKEATSTARMHPKRLVLGIYAPYNHANNMDYYFQEFLSLINTAEIHYDESLFFKIRQVENNDFLTKGKMQELTAFCDEHKIEEIVISELLTPVQERNMEDATGCKVFDREYLILDIFSQSAKTSEGKIQVEMAEIEFMKTRLIGKGREFAQQAGFIGGKGPGETLKEEIKQHFAEKFRQARKKLDILSRSRETQRKERVKKNVPVIALVGYTNAGKSSLLNRITKSNVLAEDKLFATLDITTRELFIDANKKYLVSDTVGFISQLPHNLIESFKSTLDELRYSTILLHVIDLSNPGWQHQASIVHKTLKELQIDKPLLYVFNKIDKVSAEELEALAPKLAEYEPRILINTTSKESCQPLVDMIKKMNL